MNNIKIARCSNLLLQDEKYYYMDKLQTLQYLNQRIRAGYDRVKTHDVKFVETDNKDNFIFSLIILFEPL